MRLISSAFYFLKVVFYKPDPVTPVGASIICLSCLPSFADQ